MKSPVLLTIALAFWLLQSCGEGELPSSSAGQSTQSDRSPLEVVNQRMSAYNGHDLGAFLETYSEEVAIYTYPDRSLGKGKKHLRSIFEPMFEEGTAQVTVHHQIAKDGYVVNHETVTDGDKATEYVSIYEVRGGLIESVRFVRD